MSINLRKVLDIFTEDQDFRASKPTSLGFFFFSRLATITQNLRKALSLFVAMENSIVGAVVKVWFIGSGCVLVFHGWIFEIQGGGVQSQGRH